MFVIIEVKPKTISHRTKSATPPVKHANSEKKTILSSYFKVVRDPCQKITLLLLKSKSVRVIVPESCF